MFGIPLVEKFVLILSEMLERKLYFFLLDVTEKEAPGDLLAAILTRREEFAKNEFNTEETRLTGTERETGS